MNILRSAFRVTKNHWLIRFKRFFKKILRKNALTYVDALKARDQAKLNLEDLQEIWKQRQNIVKEKERKKAELKELGERFSDPNCDPQCKKRILWN